MPMPVFKEEVPLELATVLPEPLTVMILQNIGGTIDKRAIVFGAYSPNRFKEIAETYKFNNKE